MRAHAAPNETTDRQGGEVRSVAPAPKFGDVCGMGTLIGQRKGGEQEA